MLSTNRFARDCLQLNRETQNPIFISSAENQEYKIAAAEHEFAASLGAWNTNLMLPTLKEQKEEIGGRLEIAASNIQIMKQKKNCATREDISWVRPCSSPSSTTTPLKPARFNIQQAVNKLQNQFSSFFHNLHHQHLSSTPFLNPNPNPDSTNFNFEFTLNDAKKPTRSLSHAKNPLWARIAADKTVLGGGAAMSDEDIEQRLAGVPVYALSNSSEEFVVVSGQNPVKSLGLLCFKEEDAETLLGQMKSMDPRMRPGSKVVPVALSMVFQLKVNGVSFRFIPEPSQIKNAIEARRKAGVSDDSFSGVPVFQSRSLVLMSQNKRYRPAFFRKEDLDKSLAKASNEQRHLNPAVGVGDLEVAVLEDIIHGMKDDSTTAWDDVVFIPPGFDVSTDQSRQ